MLSIKTIVITDFFQNARVLVDEKTKVASVVDPGGDVEKILELVPAGCTVESIILTHAHIDHAGGVKEMLGILRAEGREVKLFGHKADRILRENITTAAHMFGLNPNEYQNCPEPDEFIDQGSKLFVGESEIQVLFTPGHAPGHVSLYIPAPVASPNAGVLIAGDAIFAGAIGRTDLPGGDHDLLLRSIRERIFTLPENTIILSGHGGDTTVGEEKRTNPYFQ